MRSLRRGSLIVVASAVFAMLPASAHAGTSCTAASTALAANYFTPAICTASIGCPVTAVDYCPVANTMTVAANFRDDPTNSHVYGGVDYLIIGPTDAYPRPVWAELDSGIGVRPVGCDVTKQAPSRVCYYGAPWILPGGRLIAECRAFPGLYVKFGISETITCGLTRVVD